LLSKKFFSLRKSDYWRSKLSSPPAVSYHLAGANFSAGNPPPRGNPGLKSTRMDAILKKFDKKINFEFLKNVQRDHANFRSIQVHHLQPSQSCETIPLKL
jgi:hypothetical protein